MASTDARPVPRKNTAFRAYFPILDNTGSLVTGAAGLDSERTIDGGAFSDCTNEATEVAQGIYYLDLTASEMNGDAIVVIIKTSTTDAKTTTLVFYPEEIGDYRSDVQQWLGTAVTAGTAGVPNVDVTRIANAAVATGSAQLGVNLVNIAGAAVSASTAQLGVNTVQISGDAAAADNAEAFFDGTGYAGTNNVIPSVTTVTGNVNGSVASVTGAVGSVTGNVGGNVTGSVGSVTGLTASNLDATISSRAAAGSDMGLTATAIDAVLDDVVEGSTTMRQALRLFLSALASKVSGAGTTTITFRDIGDTKNRIVASVDADGNRSSLTLDVT